MTDPTCEERIADQMAGRADDVRKMLAAQRGESVCRNCGTPIIDGGVEWEHAAEAPEGSLCYLGDAGAEPEEDYDEDTLSNFGLEVTRKVTLNFLMSTGGPADWLEILCDEERHGTNGVTGADPYSVLTVERVTYHFSDWFDHAEREVSEGSPLYELAEWVAEGQS